MTGAFEDADNQVGSPATDLWNCAADVLSKAGCRAVLGVPSDDPGLMDAALRHPALELHVFGDQRIASCAAAGYAICARAPTVLSLNSGPSFANAVVGLLEASSLRAPVVVVTTGIDSQMVGRGAFQYLEQRRLVEKMVEWHELVDRPDRLAWALREAVSRSMNGPRGVTVVEIAHQVIDQPLGLSMSPEVAAVVPYRAVAAEADVERAASVLASARRPMIVVGGGWKWSAGSDEIAQLSALLSAPIFTTAAGRGAVDERDPRAFGLVGLYASPPADELLDATDAVLLLASRFEETTRLGWSAWATAPVVQVDISTAAFGESVDGVLGLHGDAGLTAAALVRCLTTKVHEDRKSWQADQDAVKTEQPVLAEVTFSESPVRATTRAAMEVLAPVSAIVQENGLHDIWTYHVPVTIVDPRIRVVCPGEQTMMGFGMGAAVGAAMAAGPGALTVLFTGDSAFSLGVGALRTMSEHALGVVIVVFDNEGLGWPRYCRSERTEADRLTRSRSPLRASADRRGIRRLGHGRVLGGRPRERTAGRW